jgi:hypothetical protein
MKKIKISSNVAVFGVLIGMVVLLILIKLLFF